jgi:hypothetical protein
MNQPVEQRFEKIEQRLSELERLEKKLDFNSRDVIYKLDLGQALLKVLHQDVRDLKENNIGIKEDIEYLKLRADESDKKLDLILQLLQKKGE